MTPAELRASAALPGDNEIYELTAGNETEKICSYTTLKKLLVVNCACWVFIKLLHVCRLLKILFYDSVEY